MGLTAVATNAIAMSMLIRDKAFGVVTVASGFVSVAFFGGFALGSPLYAYLTHYSDNLPFSLPLGWLWLMAILLMGAGLAFGLARARYQQAVEKARLAELAVLKEELAVLKQRFIALDGGQCNRMCRR